MKGCYTYRGFSLIPLTVFERGAYVAMVVVREPDGVETASGVLGRFSFRSAAYKFAVDYGMAEIDKRTNR
ncbi:hypothetical protein AWB81_08087 [Caballeronia arationis]|nr:hypothetical protein AWB81_08087 [Caballeronia arationis]